MLKRKGSKEVQQQKSAKRRRALNKRSIENLSTSALLYQPGKHLRERLSRISFLLDKHESKINTLFRLRRELVDCERIFLTLSKTRLLASDGFLTLNARAEFGLLISEHALA